MTPCLMTPIFFCVVDILVNLRQARRDDVGGCLLCRHDAGDRVVARESVPDHMGIIYK